MPLFEVISVLPFHAILVENWNAPAHRYFLSYRILGDFQHVLGLPVVDEFATFSTPIFFGPKSLLGRLYNLGITLGHQRNPEMPLDQGWPPICVGLDSDQPAETDWEDRLLDAIKSRKAGPPQPENSGLKTQQHRIGETSICATNLPLLPRQLKRLCQLSRLPLSIAFSTGNRITGQDGKLLSLDVASEDNLKQLLRRFSQVNE